MCFAGRKNLVRHPDLISVPAGGVTERRGASSAADATDIARGVRTITSGVHLGALLWRRPEYSLLPRFTSTRFLSFRDIPRAL